MKLKLFSTQRAIREWLKKHQNTILDKHTTIGEFFEKIVVVKNRKFIDKDIRKKYLFEAIQNIDISKLGFRKEFLSFSKDSEFIFGFLNELFLERVDIEKVSLSDTYVEFEEHISLIKAVREEYKKLLEKDKYIDKFLIEEYSINRGLLEGIDSIEIILDGYLSKFDIEVLSKIDKPIFVEVDVTKFNKGLVARSLFELEEGYRYRVDFHKKEVVSREKSVQKAEIEVNYFSKKFDEVNFIFAKIAELVEEGFAPDRIAVILPDETFSNYLMELDKYENLNFAMGRSFTTSNLFIKLNSVYNYLLNEDKIDYLKAGEWIEEFLNCEDVVQFIISKSSSEELRVIDEELYRLSTFESVFRGDKREFLHFILEKFKNLSFDDRYSGKVTVMGVLESRGIEFDAVVITNFNEGVVPNVNSKDLFLNSAVRKKSGLPTRMDKENLQKHYYYSLLKSSKKAVISYIKNEKESVSRFLYQLGLEEGENREKRYDEVLYKFSPKRELYRYSGKIDIKFPLTPTTLKTLLICPTQYYFSKVLKIEDMDRNKEKNFGTILHNILKEVVMDRANIVDKEHYFTLIMERIYQKFNSQEDRYEIRVKYEDGIKRFCDNDFEPLKSAKFIEVERWKSGFGVAGKELACIIDRVDIFSNKVRVIDYKSGKLSNIDKTKDFQLTFYYLWAMKQYPDKNIEVGYYDMQKGEFIPQSPNLEELEKVLNDLPTELSLSDNIKPCEYCIYKTACGRDYGEV